MMGMSRSGRETSAKADDGDKIGETLESIECV